jgi:glycosyltransferase involved in cell wall biosynthesis
LRILYHHRIGSRDGQSVHLEELIAALREVGHEVRLVGPSSFAEAKLGHEPAFIAAMKKLIPKFIYELLEIGYNIPAFFRLVYEGSSFQPDFVYERYNLYLLAGIWFKRLKGVPLLLEVNAPLAHERASFGGLGLVALARSLERLVWRQADFVLPVTGVLADEIRAAGVPEARIAVIPNGTDVEKFDAGDPKRTKEALHLERKTVLGFTGFVRDWHGLDRVLILLAQDQVPDNLHFMIVGDGPEIPALKALAIELGVADRVTYAGLVTRDHIASHVSAFDIALLPKCVEYCSPLKLFEYMAAGKAIVAPDQANVREILRDGISGLLFPPDNTSVMETAVVRLAKDEELRSRLGRAARAVIAERGLTWRNNALRVGAIGSTAAQRIRSDVT